jgi:glycosyltransferase involved in cell wall biosynthesis
MKIAVVHDYFTQMGGAEKVTEELVRLVPDATLFSTVALPDKMPSGLQGRPVVTSWMQHLPMLKKYYRLYFLLYPWAVSSLDVSDYSLVLSSSSGYAKGISTARDAIHICYCHTPMRWAWSFDSYSKREGFGSGRRFVLSHLVAALRGWDIGASRQPDHFIANSKMVAARILRAYNRVAEVIYPPIDIDRFHISTQLDDYYLVLSRLVSYKRIDLAVRACSSLGRKLLVIGDGPDLARLKALAGPTVIFAGRLPDSQVEYHAARCKALLFPGEEDFGMAPVEVAAAGRPSIALPASSSIARSRKISWQPSRASSALSGPLWRSGVTRRPSVFPSSSPTCAASSPASAPRCRREPLSTAIRPLRTRDPWSGQLTPWARQQQHDRANREPAIDRYEVRGSHLGCGRC